MVALFVKILPYLLLFYFIFRSLKEPVYLLGIPFLMFLGSCIFIENVKFFYIPGSLSYDIRFLFWIIMIGFVISYKYSSHSERKVMEYTNYSTFNFIDYVIIGLILLTVINLFYVFGEYINIENVYTEFFTLISMFIGFFVVKKIISYVNLISLESFLYSIVIINTIASFLFIIHQGLHFTIYQGEEYSTEIFQGMVITRTFWFIPVLWSFSIAYLLTFKKSKSIIFIIMLTINLLSIFISYNRSTLINNSFIILLYFLFVGYRKKDYSSIAKNIIIAVVVGVGLFYAVSQFLPASTNYFKDRFKELGKNSTDAESNNLVYRFQRTGDLINIIEPDKILIGYGPVTETQTPLVEIMHETTADMAWAGVAFRWGFLGLALFILLFIGSMIKAFNLFMKSEGKVSQLALLLLLLIVSQVIESITGWAFMSPDRLPMGLWYFGILSALLIVNKNQDATFNKEH